MFGSTKESQRRVVGDWIAKNISKCGMTNGQFCRKTNIDRQCLNNWILGKTTPHTKYFIILSQYFTKFGMNPEEISAEIIRSLDEIQEH